MTAFIITIFIAVYLSMLLGGIPGLRVDRTGAALLGAIVLLAGGAIGEKAALDSIDVPTLSLLFGLMVVSAQFQLGGFYGLATQHVISLKTSPSGLLAYVVALSAALSAVLTNDVVCFAIAPLLIQLTRAKNLNPIPYLIGLACAANVGSAATLIGNPQNILIGESLHLSFNDYFLIAITPCVLGTAVIWAIIAYYYRNDWQQQAPSEATIGEESPSKTAIGFDRWQTGKGLVVLVLLIAGFVFAPWWPRELLALAAAGILLLNRTFHSREMMGLVDWSLLVLFISLFIVNQAFAITGGMDVLVSHSESAGVSLQQPVMLFLATAVFSNLISNVPAVMLLLPIAEGEHAGAILALSSTLAGNLIIVGSIANIIVIGIARQSNIKIDIWTHARVGIPVTILSLLFAGLQLWLIS